MKKVHHYDWQDIKAALHRKGMTFTALAELYDLNPAACRKVKNSVNQKAQAAIADFLKIPAEELWPDRYPIQKPTILSSRYKAMLESKKSNVVADMEKAA
ncbi:helix-turn-helix domain-containing protein [Bartonella sp. HY761]|uniref:helix-turn-helix domain-containing protein n=1 Tax=Bartonella sp. HY761 TaxID=2979330 RepID=UPI0021FA1F59|nr:helix-turn-helix domain-containing protein [Bartonella sp. HY761]UXN07544.1 helix-turn-helix domain-containing protein [Bartonella sp. HY761]